MASSSQVAGSYASSDPCWKYDVFLSFRGPDTRKGITVDIYDKLTRRGIKAFMDDPDLQVGDAISPTLIAAIKESRFAIVILSQNYASSTWCLEELREICLSMEDNRILPLFYHVDPTDVRYQKRSFEEAFSNYETSRRHESEKVKQWRDALNKVANLSGWNTQQYKAHKELVKVIVEYVCTKVVPDPIESTGDFEVFDATRQAMNEVNEALKVDEITGIGVFGMGGVGKTTLVEHVGAQARKSGIFNYVTKSVVSQNPNFEKLQDTLAEQLRFKLHEKTEVGRAARLRAEIKRREKILIILDDVWERFDLSRIGIPTYKELQKCNSKILLTTRIRNVCHQMECQRMVTLDFLSEQDSWALFSRKARRSFESPTFEDVAKKVAKECKGLPIALITVARALGDKDLVDWKTAAQRLMKSQIANPDDDGEAYKCIKLSYDFLKDEEYKAYFLLCCLFPEDDEIYIENLFRNAIGKGLFRDADTIQEARDRAESLARHLQYSCLLLECKDGRFLRMHDVVRDAAIQIAQSEGGFLVKVGCGLKDWPRQLHEGCSVISLLRNHIRKLPEKLVCPKLHILLLGYNYRIKEVPEAFFQSPNELRVLDLSWTHISSLPQSCNLLTDLQTLCLDKCNKITDISIIGKLKRLEILSMRGIFLKELSIEVGGLTNLRILDNRGGYIDRIPPKVMSALYSLEELYIDGFRNWGIKVEGAGENTNACFDEVTTLSKLRVLRVAFSNAKCIPKYVEHKLNWVQFTISTGSFYCDQSSDNSIYLTLNKISRLPKWFCNEIMNIAERLRWHGCQRLIDIFVESEHGRLTRLKHLHIGGSKRRSITKVDLTITWVPKTPVFKNLEELYLEGLDCAELCAVEFLPPGSLFNLKVLHVKYCYNWGNILLPSILLQRLPNLENLLFKRTDGGTYMFGYEALLLVRQLKLKRISLTNLATTKICEGPAPPAMFQELQTLSIFRCMLEGSLFTYDVARCLSQLNYLRVDNCPMLERIVEASNKKIILPKLEQLSLVKLPMLYYEHATFDIECPSLKQFFLEDCPKFSKTILLLTSTAGNESDSDDVDDDDMDDKFRGSDLAGFESDAHEFDYAVSDIMTLLNRRAADDTTATQARRGKDIQGIPWDRLAITREKYRQTKLEQYENYENIPNSGEWSGKDCIITKKGYVYYEFRRNTRSVKSPIQHFQLRNLVWATSKHDVYLMSHYSVIHWSSISRSQSEVLNVSGHVEPSETHPGSLLEGFRQTQVSTFAVKDKLLVAGGFQGELICKHLDRPGVSFCSRTTSDANAITNAVEIYDSPSGAVHFTASSSDCGVRDFDMEKFQLAKHFRFPWPVNHTSLSPNGKLLVVVGDNPDGMLVDSQTGKTVTAFSGHLDFSFASAWHPDGVTFATGNQDKTCRVWDVRNLSKSVAVLKGNLGAIRSIRYTSDGRYMMMAEPADFVHVYDVNSEYEKEQEIDIFGEISGVSFSPDTESLFIGVYDRPFGGLLEYGILNSAP